MLMMQGLWTAVYNGYLVSAKDARSMDCSVPENPGVNSSTLGMPDLDCSVQWILGECKGCKVYGLQCARESWCQQ